MLLFLMLIASRSTDFRPMRPRIDCFRAGWRRLATVVGDLRHRGHDK
ncbi:hypothetical protein N136_04908 [Leifsonia aquatica ATCC 14665]|uniref:Uncharacterized protein n=1 Tax=Leifsonia aquatica ATCC 14665 TaxID=1358026 RepID=U2S5E4_LEIAQ|nr:hypothetical protein N136_04908 [Leifsonia aquatica ATCC 14665]